MLNPSFSKSSPCPKSSSCPESSPCPECPSCSKTPVCPETLANSTAAVLGVVLAGGLSSRLGEDKVRLLLHEDGTDMLAHTVALLGSCVCEVLVSCRANAALPYACIPDELDQQGPFGALYTILRRVHQPVFVLSCDLPFMDRATLARLLAARENRAPGAIMTTFQQMETGYIEALVAIYEPECRGWFEAAQARGIRQLNQVVPVALREHVRYAQDASLPFFNINYPSDLEAARRIVQIRATS